MYYTNFVGIYYWSPRVARSLLFLSLTLCVCMSVCLSVCLSVCHKLQIDSSFLFLNGIESFLAVSSLWPPLQNVVLRFRLPNTINLLPKICTKSPITRLVWQIDSRCLHLPGSFVGWPIQWNHAKCCGADPCCQGNEIWARRGDLVAYRLVSYLILYTGDHSP